MGRRGKGMKLDRLREPAPLSAQRDVAEAFRLLCTAALNQAKDMEDMGHFHTEALKLLGKSTEMLIGRKRWLTAAQFKKLKAVNSKVLEELKQRA